MRTDPIFRAWIALLVLSGLATTISVLAGSVLDSRIAGALVLALALAKSRVILSRYLGLWQAPAWLRGFTVVLALFCLIVLGLYLAA